MLSLRPEIPRMPCSICSRLMGDRRFARGERPTFPLRRAGVTNGNGVQEHGLIRHLPGLAEEPPALAVLRGLDGPAVQPLHLDRLRRMGPTAKGTPDYRAQNLTAGRATGLSTGRRGDRVRLALLRAGELYGRRVRRRRRLEHDLADVDVHEDGRPAGTPSRAASHSGSSTSRWIVRRSGRAPKAGSKPCSASSSFAASVSSMSTSFAFSCSRTRFIIRSTICFTSSRLSELEDDDLVDPVEELRPEALLQLLGDLLLHLVVGHLDVRTRGEPDAGTLLDVLVPRFDSS